MSKNILFIKAKKNKLNKKDLYFDYAKNKNNYKFKIQKMNHINKLYKKQPTNNRVKNNYKIKLYRIKIIMKIIYARNRREY